jgi:hypothetical protein
MKKGPQPPPITAVGRRAAVYLALLTVAVAQPLLQLYGSSVAVFASANYEGAIVVVFGLVVLLVPTAVFTATDVVVTSLHPTLGMWVHRLLVLVASWAVALVVLRNLSFGPWGIDMLYTGVIALGMTWLIDQRSAVTSWVTYLSPLSIVVAISFVVSAMSVISPPDVQVLAIEKDSIPEVKVGTPRDQVSVVWIVLDEAPLWPLMTTTGEINANRYPGFAALASSSTWYRNVLATSQTTTDAVPAMLTGKWPVSNTSPVLVKHPKNLFTLMNGHMSMDAHEVATALCPKKVCNKVSVTGGDHIAFPGGTSTTVTDTTIPTEEEVVVVSRRTPFTSFLKDALVVVGHKVLPKELRSRLPAIDEGWGGFGAMDNGEIDNDIATSTTVPGPTTTLSLTEEKKQQANSTTVKQWQSGGPMSQVPVLDEVINRAARADRPTLHFAHVLTPHRPWMLTPDMRRSRALNTDKRSNTVVDRVRDQYQAHLLQYVATDNMIAKLVTDLKRSANWNRTMVIVTADHGITFELGENKRSKINVKSPATLEDIYRVPLFIKYPDQSVGDVNDCATSSIDIFPTVVAATGIDAGWTFDGVDLKTSCPVRESRKIVWKTGSHSLSTTFADIVKRAVRYDEWVDAEGNAEDIVRAGQHGDIINGAVMTPTGPDITSMSWSVQGIEDFNAISESSFFVDGEFGFVPTQVEGALTATETFGSDAEGVLVYNGKAVGMVSELAGLKKGASASFRSTLNWKYLHGPPVGAGLEMWVVQGTSAARVIQRVATP